MFITFEGIEGSGKSTQAQILYQSIKSSPFFGNREVLLTREPGGTLIGDRIREILLDSNIEVKDPLTEYLCYYASRVEHWQQKILPALSRNAIVISDRFFDSSIAYQVFAMNLDFKIATKLHSVIVDAISVGSNISIVPNLTILCDLSVENSFARIKDRSSNNRYENFSYDFHNKVRLGFIEIAKSNPERFSIVDASKEKNLLAQDIWQIFSLF